MAIDGELLRTLQVEARQLVGDSNDPWLKEVLSAKERDDFADGITLLWLALQEIDPYPATQEIAVAMIKDLAKKEMLAALEKNSTGKAVVSIMLKTLEIIAEILIAAWWREARKEGKE